MWKTAQHPNENIVTWTLWCWDAEASNVDLDCKEALWLVLLGIQPISEELVENRIEIIPSETEF